MTGSAPRLHPFCFDAFSLREPVSISLENAMGVFVVVVANLKTVSLCDAGAVAV
ncbi:hypothetical protein [Bradyrhizobium canariense]|jgi:hypothetical protein|uniref:Uncharacterized protein n=1 Tax=Bradyrhizobium canariense TaxID=255045 RepID=A0A1H1ZLE0_9BRAD|nr:hypothetical protein [Bradyrhizobium canariense]SDT34548.1 hypothetical protein SAMN05444158_5527 [Bradyrhizobium canariense]